MHKVIASGTGAYAEKNLGLRKYYGREGGSQRGCTGSDRIGLPSSSSSPTVAQGEEARRAGEGAAGGGRRGGRSGAGGGRRDRPAEARRGRRGRGGGPGSGGRRGELVAAATGGDGDGRRRAAAGQARGGGRGPRGPESGPAGRRRGEAGGGHVALAGWPGGAADVSGAGGRVRRGAEGEG